MGEAIRATGLFSEKTANNPQRITESKTWNELMEIHLSDDDLSRAHKELLMSTTLDHMVFPLGPLDEDDPNFSGATPSSSDLSDDDEGEGETHDEAERTTMTDAEIIELLAGVNCQVRKIVHGKSARHVYFWSRDNRARKDALDMAYKLKKRYGDAEAPPAANRVYNFFFDQRFQTNIKGYEDTLKKQILNAEKNKATQKAVDPDGQGPEGGEGARVA
ncbi:MAG: hypothetical protein WC767_03680 [Candidatus Paceibacterota bacterium]